MGPLLGLVEHFSISKFVCEFSLYAVHPDPTTNVLQSRDTSTLPGANSNNLVNTSLVLDDSWIFGLTTREPTGEVRVRRTLRHVDHTVSLAVYT